MVTRLRLQAFVAIVGLFAIAAALAYFLLVVTPVQEPAPGGTYVEGVIVNSTDGIIFNPLYAPTNSFSQDVTTLIFSGLTRSVNNPDNNDPGQTIEPDIADSWTVTPDGRSWEFHLRHDARWQDGTPITAKDVVYTIGVLQSDDFKGSRTLAAPWKDVKVTRLGDYSVRFDLSQPDPAFLSYTSLGLLPDHKLNGKAKNSELASNNLDFNRAPVGNGPYEIAPGGLAADGVTLIANPLYFGQKPYLDKVWFRFYQSGNAALSALQANQIDGVSEVTSDELAKLNSLKNVTQISAPQSLNTYLFLNLQRDSLFGQKEVRQALDYAINKPALVKDALSGEAQVSYSPILSSSWAYKSDINQYSYDPAHANQLLDAAGWPVLRNGVRERNGQQLVFELLINDTLTQQAAANAITDDLKAINVQVYKKVIVSLPDFETALSASNYDAVLFTIQGIPNDPDPYNTWYSNYAQAGDNHLNFANWKSDQGDQLLEQARQTMDQSKRRDLYLQWQTLWADQLPSIPLYTSTYNYLVSNGVYGVNPKDFKVINSPSDRLKDITARYIFFDTKFSS